MEAIDLFSQKTDQASAHGNLRAPTEDLLLQVDRSYRQKAAQNALPKVAPRHLNRSGVAWLPVMHVSYGKWHFTARFSNTLRANQMGKTSDWVIISYHSDDDYEGQVTVVSQKKTGQKKTGQKKTGQKKTGQQNRRQASVREVRGLVKHPV